MNEKEKILNEQADEAFAAPEPQAEPAAEERLRALEEREAALDLRERQARMRTELNRRELPESLAACLDLSSDSRADETLETLTAAFSDAVNRRVQERLGAEPPRAAAGIPDALAAVRRAMGLK